MTTYRLSPHGPSTAIRAGTRCCEAPSAQGRHGVDRSRTADRCAFREHSRRRELRRIEIVPNGRLAKQTSAMRHELPECNVFVKRVVRLKIGQVLLVRSVQVEFTALDELHHANVGEQLRDGTDAVNGFGTCGNFLVGIPVAESLGPYNLL